MLHHNETRSRTLWRRRMGETRSALCSSTMKHDHAHTEGNEWEKHDQHYAPGRWDTITYILKETNGRNTISTMLQHNETRSRTSWRRRMGETRSALGSRTMRRDHARVVCPRTIGQTERSEWEKQWTLRTGTIRHDHPQAEWEKHG